MNPGMDMDMIIALQTACADGYEAGRQDTIRWISVKDRLPETDGEYLVAVKCDGYRMVTTLAFAPNLHKLDPNTFPCKKNCIPGWYWFDCGYGYVNEDRVTHWQELPEPPKEEE